MAEVQDRIVCVAGLDQLVELGRLIGLAPGRVCNRKRPREWVMFVSSVGMVNLGALSLVVSLNQTANYSSSRW